MAAPARGNSKRRILGLFLLCGVAVLLLGLRLGWIMIVDGDEYKNKAQAQQTRDTEISADRGTIYDVNMKELAVNAPAYTVWVRPAELSDKKGNATKMAQIIAKVIDGDVAEIEATLKKNSTIVRVAKDIDSDKADKLRQYMSDGKLPGISLDETTKRNYPYGDFASAVIGTTNSDSTGVSGVELSYNAYLSGTSGRLIRNTDASGRKLSYGTEKYYEPTDGLNLVLTIDEVLQHYLEDAIESACKDTNAKRSMGIAMNPHTGEILAMAIYPGYDLNEPRVPVTEEGQEELEALENDEQKVDYWNQMWRNFMVSDTYEPGSTFKLITTAIALEEGLTTTSETFNCTGYYQLYTDTLRCWSYKNPHGYETLAQAIQNSCNPVQVTLALRIGAQKYYQYLDALGFSSTTGVDLPSETKAIMYNKESIRPAELATMSYGQGISVTPIQLIKAIAAISNGGYSVTPHVVKEVIDDDGEVIYESETKANGRVFSEETSDEMRKIMQSVVDEGTGKSGYIPGYKVGGKTGTADKVIDGRYVSGKVYSSFISIAPSDDPEIITLFIVDEPPGVHYASAVVVPYVKQFLENALPYLQVEPEYTADELAHLDEGTIPVGDVVGKTVTEAKKALNGQGLKVVVEPENYDDDDEIVDMYPKGGDKVKNGSTVYIYTK